MPYLQYLFCEKCGEKGNLDIDFLSTIQAYQEEGRKSAFINQSTMIWDYIIYTCYQCGEKYKYTYQEVEKRVREYFCSLSEEHKAYYTALAEQKKLERDRIRGTHKVKKDTPERIKKIYANKEK